MLDFEPQRVPKICFFEHESHVRAHLLKGLVPRTDEYNDGESEFSEEDLRKIFNEGWMDWSNRDSGQFIVVKKCNNSVEDVLSMLTTLHLFDGAPSCYRT